MLHNGVSTGVDGTRFRSAYGIEYSTGKLMVRSEYLWGVTDFALYTNGPYGEDYHFVPDPAHSHGFYVVAGYWFGFGWGNKSPVRQKLRPVVRFDYYQKDLDLNDRQPSIFYSAGLDWWPEKHVRVQLNYTLKQHYNTHDWGHNLTAMTTVKF